MFSSVDALGLLVDFPDTRRADSLARPGSSAAPARRAGDGDETKADPLRNDDCVSMDPHGNGGLACRGARLDASELGLDRRFTLGLWLTAVVGSVLLGVLQWFNLRRVSRLTGPAADFMRRLAERLLPGNAVELLPYCALAITAGVCEEFSIAASRWQRSRAWEWRPGRW